MKILSRYYKKIKIAYIKVAVFVSVIAALFLPQRQTMESTGDNSFTVYLNGVEVGVMGDIEEVDECLIRSSDLRKNRFISTCFDNPFTDTHNPRCE